MSDAFWDDLKKDLEDYEFRKEFERRSYELPPKGKVAIIKDNDRVIDKWSLRLMYTIVLLSALSWLLRLIGWVMS